MKIKKTAVLFLLLLCIGSVFSPRARAEEPKRSTSLPRGRVNIYFYVIGSDLESVNSQATEDLREMARGISRSEEDVGVFIYGGGTKTWHNYYFDSDSNNCYYLAREASVGVYAEEKRDMTDPAVLENFLKKAWAYREADRNFLILWDHGGGTMGGFGVDEFYPESDGMSVLEIGTALKNSGIHFDMVGFDACLMGSVETALALGDSADYLVASEGMIPGTGWNYDSWITALGRDSDISAEQLGRTICDEYIRVSRERCPNQNACLSVTDLKLLSEKLPDALSALGTRLCLRIAAGEYDKIAKARMNAGEYGDKVNTEEIDFLQFCDDLGVEESQAVSELVRRAVCYEVHTELMHSGGLSMYLPFHSLQYTDDYLTLCEQLGIPRTYRLFISYFNAMEVCGQTMQMGSLSYFGFVYGENFSSEKLLGEAELKERILQGMDGTKPFTELGLNNRNSRFLRDVFEDEELLNLAVKYVQAYSFQPSRLSWIASGWGGQVLLGFGAQEKVVGKIYEEIALDLDPILLDLGWVPIDFSGLAARVRGIKVQQWYAINDNLCAVYCLDSSVQNGETYMSALIPASYNGVSGYLSVKLTESGQSSIAGFMVGYTRENFGMWGKIVSSLDFRDDDVITLQANVYDPDGTLIYQGDFSDPMRWGDGLKLEKRRLMDGLSFLVYYRVCDIYGNYYALEKEK